MDSTASAAVLPPVPTFTNPALAATSQAPYGIACPDPRSAKQWSRTCTGSPLGRHSAPACAYSPTCSFFLASTLITGSPAARCSFACAAMYRNWASRSGCRLPSPTRALAWVENPTRAAAATPSADSPVPLPRSAHRTASSRSWSSTAAATADPPEQTPPPGPAAPRQPRIGPASFLRPPPARRIRPAGANCPDSSSATPSATVCHDAPVLLGHRRDPAVPGRPRHRPQRQPPRLLIQPGSSSSSCGPISFTSSAFAPIPVSWHPTRRKLRLIPECLPDAQDLPPGQTTARPARSARRSAGTPQPARHSGPER